MRHMWKTGGEGERKVQKIKWKIQVDDETWRKMKLDLGMFPCAARPKHLADIYQQHLGQIVMIGMGLI